MDAADFYFNQFIMCSFYIQRNGSVVSLCRNRICRVVSMDDCLVYNRFNTNTYDSWKCIDFSIRTNKIISNYVCGCLSAFYDYKRYVMSIFWCGVSRYWIFYICPYHDSILLCDILYETDRIKPH